MIAPRGRNAFGDPATGDVYVWQRNHEEEQAGARAREIDNAQPNRSRWELVRAIRTQGARDQLVMRLTGKVPTVEQHKAFLHYLQLSIAQTIYFFHAAGEVYECQLSDYEPQRSYDPGARQNYLWAYTLQIDVIQKFT